MQSNFFYTFAAMKKKKDNRGGKRANAGRKPVKDKKELVPLYIQKSVIKKHGGLDKTKQAATDYLINAEIAQ